MPTILQILGWRLFFYANEGNEPIHVHCRKGDRECKFWLDRVHFDIHPAYMSPRDEREIKKVIFEHFEYIEEQWDHFQQRR